MMTVVLMTIAIITLVMVMMPAVGRRVRMFAGEKLGVDLQNRVQVEAAHIEHVCDGHVTEIDRLDRRTRVHLHQAAFQRFRIGVGYKVDLTHQYAVGKCHLILGFGLLIQRGVPVLGVNHRDHRVEHVVGRDAVVHEERLRHRTRIRQPGGLDDDAFEVDLARLPLRLQVIQYAHQIAAHRAADAAVVHLDDLLALLRDQQLVIDPNGAEFILDDRNFLAVLLGQNAIEQRGLAGAQKPRENGHRHLRHVCIDIHKPPPLRVTTGADLLSQFSFRTSAS